MRWPAGATSTHGLLTRAAFSEAEEGCFGPPPRLANGGSLQGLLGAAHPPRGTIFVVTWALLALANFREFPFHALRCIKKPGPDLYDPGSLRIDFCLLAVLAVPGAFAPALVREAELLPAAVLALLLRRWGAAHDREGCCCRRRCRFTDRVSE